MQMSDAKARNIRPDSRPIAHGGVVGLRLEPAAAKGQGKWILRYVSPVTGKRRDMGLGSYPAVGVAAARGKGAAARDFINDGKDPIEARLSERQAREVAAQSLTFEQAARAVHEEQKAGWRNAKHIDQWINTLRDYAFPKIGNRKIADLKPGDFADLLRAIWLDKPETAGRVKQRCNTVMKWCWAHDLVSGNPVEVVTHLLPQQPGKRERVRHQPAMPWRDVSNFLLEVVRINNPNVSRALLEFVILTAARSGEARQMEWSEVDLSSATWTVPATRMKARVTQRVPLSARAIEILECQRRKHPEAKLVFPAPRGGILSDMTLTKFLRDHNANSSDTERTATAHGFRSSFRDWASENGYPRDLAERTLAHTIKDQSEAAYHRTDLLEQRRPMMEAWAAQINGLASPSNVVGIGAKAAAQ